MDRLAAACGSRFLGLVLTPFARRENSTAKVTCQEGWVMVAGPLTECVKVTGSAGTMTNFGRGVRLNVTECDAADKLVKKGTNQRVKRNDVAGEYYELETGSVLRLGLILVVDENKKLPQPGRYYWFGVTGWERQEYEGVYEIKARIKTLQSERKPGTIMGLDDDWALTALTAVGHHNPRLAPLVINPMKKIPGKDGAKDAWVPRVGTPTADELKKLKAEDLALSCRHMKGSFWIPCVQENCDLLDGRLSRGKRVITHYSTPSFSDVDWPRLKDDKPIEGFSFVTVAQQFVRKDQRSDGVPPLPLDVSDPAVLARYYESSTFTVCVSAYANALAAYGICDKWVWYERCFQYFVAATPAMLLTYVKTGNATMRAPPPLSATALEFSTVGKKPKEDAPQPATSDCCRADLAVGLCNAGVVVSHASVLTLMDAMQAHLRNGESKRAKYVSYNQNMSMTSLLRINEDDKLMAVSPFHPLSDFDRTGLDARIMFNVLECYDDLRDLSPQVWQFVAVLNTRSPKRTNVDSDAPPELQMRSEMFEYYSAVCAKSTLAHCPAHTDACNDAYLPPHGASCDDECRDSCVAHRDATCVAACAAARAAARARYPTPLSQAEEVMGEHMLRYFEDGGFAMLRKSDAKAAAALAPPAASEVKNNVLIVFAIRRSYLLERQLTTERTHNELHIVPRFTEMMYPTDCKDCADGGDGPTNEGEKRSADDEDNLEAPPAPKRKSRALMSPAQMSPAQIAAMADFADMDMDTLAAVDDDLATKAADDDDELVTVPSANDD